MSQVLYVFPLTLMLPLLYYNQQKHSRCEKSLGRAGALDKLLISRCGNFGAFCVCVCSLGMFSLMHHMELLYNTLKGLN